MEAWLGRRVVLVALCAVGVAGPLVAAVAIQAARGASSSHPATASRPREHALGLVAVVGQVTSMGGVATEISVYVAAGRRFQGQDVDFAVAPTARVLVDRRGLFPFDARSICGLFLLNVRMRPKPSVTHGELLTHVDQCLRNVLRAGRPMSAREARAALRQYRKSAKASPKA